jgi:hypothetical protein
MPMLVSFNLLQHHRSAAQALLLYVFDVLSDGSQRLLKLPICKKREGRRRIFRV